MKDIAEQDQELIDSQRTQIETDEAIHNIKHIAADQSGLDELKEQAKRMQWLLRQLAMSFPSKKDWLDPALEKEAKYWSTAALSSNAAQSAGQGPVAQLDHAMDVVGDVSSGKRNWTMSVPARHDSDPDLVISSALRAAKDAIASTQPVEQKPVGWQYSFIHSSATGRGDSEVGSLVTHDKSVAFGIGCINQKPLYTHPSPAPAVAGEARQGYLNDPKYGIKHGRLVNLASGEAIPDDEPVLIVRAKDRLAIAAIQYYRSKCDHKPHRRALLRRVNDFAAFAKKNPNRMKFPDTAAPSKGEES